MSKTDRPDLIQQCPWGQGRFWVVCFFLDILIAFHRREDAKSKKTKGGRPSSRGLAELHQLRDEICRRYKLTKKELQALAMKEEKLRIEQKEAEDRNFRRMMADDRCWSPWEGF